MIYEPTEIWQNVSRSKSKLQAAEVTLQVTYIVCTWGWLLTTSVQDKLCPNYNEQFLQ